MIQPNTRTAQMITLGRRPTLSEVLDYYTQESFLRFLLATTRYRRVVLVISEKKHWEPRWPRDEVRAETVGELRTWIRSKVETALPDVAPGAKPDFYPAFHQSVWKGDPPTRVDASRKVHMDCVFEADLPTWRDAFHDLWAVIELLERHQISYQHKFSGHRSLHVVIPGDVLPSGYRGEASSKLARALVEATGSQAHHLPKITRIPYSLNEDTGLVCLPIERGGLPAFRPWQANLHLVDVPETPWELWGTAADRRNLRALLDGVGSEDGDRKRAEGVATIPPPLELDRLRSLLTSLGKRTVWVEGFGAAGGSVGAAVRMLFGTEGVPEPDLLESLTADDADTRWLAVEAFLLHGRSVSREGVEALLREDEEYVRVSATDVLLRFEDDVLPYVLEALRHRDRYSETGARAAYLLTQSPSMREAVFEALIANPDPADSHDGRITVACLTGALIGDWDRAAALVRPVEDAAARAELDAAGRDPFRKKLRALQMLSELGGWNKKEEVEKAHRIAALGSEVTDLLLIAANSPERRFRRSVVAVLAELADPRAVDLLIHALEDDYSQVRRRAIAGLNRIGDPAVDPLIEAASSDRLRTRRYAVHCLGCIGAVRAKPTIIEALDDSEEVVRRQAVRALKDSATVEDLPALKSFLREAQPENAMEATEVLEALGDVGVEVMRAMALDEGVAGAAYYIAREGDARGRGILAAHLEAGGEACTAAVEFLRELRDPRAVPYLIDQLERSTDWRGAFLARELGAIGTAEAVAALVEALNREEHLIRRGAVRGLDEARDPSAVDALIGTLDDPDGKVRRLASEALAHLGPPAVSAVREVLDAVGSGNGRLRSILRSTLESLEVDL